MTDLLLLIKMVTIKIKFIKYRFYSLIYKFLLEKFFKIQIAISLAENEYTREICFFTLWFMTYHCLQLYPHKKMPNKRIKASMYLYLRLAIPMIYFMSDKNNINFIKTATYR